MKQDMGEETPSNTTCGFDVVDLDRFRELITIENIGIERFKRVDGDDLLTVSYEIDVVGTEFDWIRRGVAKRAICVKYPELFETNGSISLEQLRLIVNKVEKVDGKHPIFYACVNNAKVEFSSTEFGSMSKWREKLLNINIVLGDRGRGVMNRFDGFILSLLENIEVVWTEELSEEEIVADIIMNEVYKLLIVDTDEQFLNNPTAARLNGDTVLEVKSSTLLSIIDRKNVNYSLRAVREFLRPYMVRNAKQKRICGKLVSVWSFEASSTEDEQNV